MPKSKLIKPSELDLSNRKLLAAAQQAGLPTDEIIRKSLHAAYGRFLKRGGGQVKPAASAKKHNHSQNHDGVKPTGKQTTLSPRTTVDGDHGREAKLRKPRR